MVPIGEPNFTATVHLPALSTRTREVFWPAGKW